MSKQKEMLNLPEEVVIKVDDLSDDLVEKVGELVSDYLVGKYHRELESFSLQSSKLIITDIDWAD